MKCDLNTRILAAKVIDFTYQGHFELKGKSISTPFFKPENPSLRFKMARMKGYTYENYL